MSPTPTYFAFILNETSLVAQHHTIFGSTISHEDLRPYLRLWNMDYFGDFCIENTIKSKTNIF